MSIDRPPTPPTRFSTREQGTRKQAISFLMQQAVENAHCISLAAGLVDPGTLPVELMGTLTEELFADPQTARSALQYGTTPGSLPAREAVHAHFAGLEGRSPDELPIDPDRLVLSTGSQQILSIVAETLFDPGDICLVAAPTYFVFLSVLEGVGARAVPVKTDGDGMCPEHLAETLSAIEAAGELDRVKLIYVVSDYDNPSGISLATERRAEVVRLAKEWSRSRRIFVLEDAAYRELRYDGPDRPSVWSFDEEHDTVIYTQTFSKSFSPGVRVGFGILPESLTGPVIARKGNEDFGSPNLNQTLIGMALTSGRYLEHVERVRESYRFKRDTMLDAIETHCAPIEGLSWVRPEGGLYVWMTLPDGVEAGFDGELFRVATAGDGVMYVPGEIACPQRTYAEELFSEEDRRPMRSRIRLSYGVQTEEGLRMGIERLAVAIRQVQSTRLQS